MTPSFHSVDLSEIRSELVEHLNRLPGPIESFIEDQIRKSRHYRIVVDDHAAGFGSILEGKTITQFVLSDEYRSVGQAAYQRMRKMESVTGALVATCDEFFLAHAIDDYRQLRKEAYMFVEATPEHRKTPPEGYELQVATETNAQFLHEASEGFFDDAERHINAGEIYIVRRNEEPVGFGIIERAEFRHHTASIGMYTIAQYRRTGVATATILLLLRECAALSLRPLAGCWYYNHFSKQTLERAGMASTSRLLKIDY